MKKTLFAVVAAAALFLCWAPVAPTAGADPLPNGYDVNCSLDGNVATCAVSGCPRVDADDDAADVVHVKFNSLPQKEVGIGCNASSGPISENVPAGAPFTFSVQGCQKHKLTHDDCGAFSTYTFTPPPAPAPVVAPPAAPVVSNAGEPVRCTFGDYTLPPGSDCSKTPNPNPPPAPDVTNAIQASFGQPGLTSIDFNVTNTSNLTATCHYTATANSLNPLVPRKTTRQFNVPANGNVTQTFDGAPTLTNYNVTLSCSDASGKQKAELGHVETSVLW